MGDMPLDDARHLIDQVADLGVEEFLITGGEPMVRADLPAVIEHLGRRGVRYSINTAVCPPEPVRAAMRKHPPTFAAVSLDGPREVHDRFRGRDGAFDDALAAIAALGALCRGGVAAGTTVTSQNFPHLARTFLIVLESGAGSWGIHLPVPEGRAARRKDLFLEKPQLRRLLDFVAAKRNYFPVQMADENGLLRRLRALGPRRAVGLRGGPGAVRHPARRQRGPLHDAGPHCERRQRPAAAAGGDLARRFRRAARLASRGPMRRMRIRGGLRRRVLAATASPSWPGVLPRGLARAGGLEDRGRRGRLPRGDPGRPGPGRRLPRAAGEKTKTLHTPDRTIPWERGGDPDPAALTGGGIEQQILMWTASSVPPRYPRVAKFPTEPPAPDAELLQDPAWKFFVAYRDGTLPADLASYAKAVEAGLKTKQRSLSYAALLWRSMTERLLADKGPAARGKEDRQLVRQTLADMEKAANGWRKEIFDKRLDPYLAHDRRVPIMVS